jgi:lipopolysaccharide biosynthesis glycosyltransferase
VTVQNVLRNARVIRNSKYFDPVWYRKEYLKKSIFFCSPALHYLLKGHRRGLDPSPEFSTTSYLNLYHDVRDNGMNPLLHFELFGDDEGRTPVSNDYGLIKNSKFWNEEWYSKRYLSKEPDLDAIKHYLTQGITDKIDPSRMFSSYEYYLCNPDVQLRGINPLLHYEKTGKHEQRGIVLWNRLQRKLSSVIQGYDSEPREFHGDVNKLDIKIFVSCKTNSHTAENPLLHPIQTGAALATKSFEGMIRDNTGDNISSKNEYYCELTAQYWAWKNIDADYYGFFHNRRYLSFNTHPLIQSPEGVVMLETISDATVRKLRLDETTMRQQIAQYDVIVAHPLDHAMIDSYGLDRTVYGVYGHGKDHQIADLDLAAEIVKRRHPDFAKDVDDYLNSSEGFYLNLFIMRKSLFSDYCEWLFPILEELYQKQKGIKRSAYGKRFVGFVAERLCGIYLTHLIRSDEELKIKLAQFCLFDDIKKKNEETDHSTTRTKPKKDIKIFVSNRIDLEADQIDNPLFFPIRCGAFFDEKQKDQRIAGDDTGDNISKKRMSFNELTVQYWAWKNVKADYYGLCHYRRYLSFSKDKWKTDTKEWNNGCIDADCLSEHNIKKFKLNENSMREIIEDYDVILAEPIDLTQYSSLMTNYISMTRSPDYHNLDDMDIALSILKEKYPEMAKTADRYMKSNKSRLYNCFIMRADIFNDYSKWLFDILFELEQRLDMKNYSYNMTRPPGTIGERLFAIYCLWLHEQKVYRIKESQLVFFNDTKQQPKLAPRFNDKNVAIVTNLNDAYASIFSVFLLSMLRFISRDVNYDLIVLTQDFSKDTKQRISKIIADYKNVSIRYYNPKHLFSGTQLKIHHENLYSEELYFRLLIPYILEGYDKALVVDVDMICLTDLSELFMTNITGYLAAGVRDTIFQGYLNGMDPTAMDYAKKCLRLNNPYDYCNTGVLLMNLKELRETYTLTEIIHMVRTHHYRIYEQDTLNVLLNGRIKFLEQNWNVYTYTNDYVKACASLATRDGSDQYEKARKSPKIIHFAAHPKPWDVGEADFSDEFWKVAFDSPFIGRILSHLNGH